MDLPISIEPAAIGMWLVILGVVLGIYMKMRAWERSLRGDAERREVSPIPLPVHLQKEPFDGERFERAETERKEDRKRILTTLDAIQKDLLESNRYQAQARQKIHGRLNRHENALYYLAGKEEARGDTHAARVIRKRLESKDDE